MRIQKIVKRNARVEGPETVRDNMKRGRNEKNDSVFGLAYA